VLQECRSAIQYAQRHWLCARRAFKGADLAAWRHSPAAVLPPPPKLKTAAAALVGEGDAALQMARCNVSKDAFYSGAVRRHLGFRIRPCTRPQTTLRAALGKLSVAGSGSNSGVLQLCIQSLPALSLSG
jgi:hypothetical protein